MSNFEAEQPSLSNPALIDKNKLITALQQLADAYPDGVIPRAAVQEVFERFIGPQNIGRLQDHPAIQKLDDILGKARTNYSP